MSDFDGLDDHEAEEEAVRRYDAERARMRRLADEFEETI